MRKLLLCLTLAGISLSLGTAQAQPLPLCSSYCCKSTGPTSTTKCLHNNIQRTCAWYWFNYACP